MAKGHRSQIKVERNRDTKDTRPKASVKYVSIPASKARIVLREIKGKDARTAVALLDYSPRYASKTILKVLNSAIANAENNLGMDKKDLFVQEVYAEQAPINKRIRPRAKGSADRILKRSCHIRVILNER